MGAESSVAAGPVEPIGARRRRELREQLSTIATRMFLERGFDAVRVADVARAAGVTAKTVFNHYPTKEALVADRWAPMTEAAAHLIADPDRTPLDGALAVLDEELEVLLAEALPPVVAVRLGELARFRELLDSTPALRAHELEAMDRLTATIALALARRSDARTVMTDAPGDWVTATALVGLWTVFYRSLRRHLDSLAAEDPGAALARAIRDDLALAAGVLRQGLSAP